MPLSKGSVHESKHKVKLTHVKMVQKLLIPFQSALGVIHDTLVMLWYCSSFQRMSNTILGMDWHCIRQEAYPNGHMITLFNTDAIEGNVFISFI